MGLFGSLFDDQAASAAAAANPSAHPFRYALDKTLGMFLPAPGAPVSGPRTFSGDMHKVWNDAAAAQAHPGFGGTLNPLNAIVTGNNLVNGTIHAASGPAGKALYHHGIEATTLPEALRRGAGALPALLAAPVDPGGAAAAVPRILFKRRTGPETAQGLARTQNRTELAGQGAFMAVTLPTGVGGAETPAAVEAVAPKVAGIVERIGNRLSNGAGMTQAAAEEQAMAQILQAVKADGATPEQFAGIVKKWTDAGSDAPSLYDALGSLPGRGQNTRSLIMDAIPRNADAAETAAQYARDVGTRMKPRVLDAVRTLKPQETTMRGLESAEQAAQQAGGVDADLAGRLEAARYSRNHVLADDRTAFWDDAPGVMKAGPDGVDPMAARGTGTMHDATQAGMYEGLYQGLKANAQPAADLMNHLSGQGHMLDTLRDGFGRQVDGFAQRIGNEGVRNQNAIELNRGFDPYAAMRPDGSVATAAASGAAKLAPNPAAQDIVGAVIRRFIPGTLKTDGELSNIARIATGPAQAIADPPRLAAATPAFSARAVALPASVAPLTQPAPLDKPQTDAAQSSDASWPPFSLWQ